MALLLLALSANISLAFLSVEKTKSILISAELANKDRTLLENNFDKIVLSSLLEEISAGNFNVSSVQSKVSLALSGFLKGKAFASDIFFQNPLPVSAEFILQNSSVLVLKGKEASYAEFSFTSNLSKTAIISNTFGGELKIPFFVPAGYTVRVLR